MKKLFLILAFFLFPNLVLAKNFDAISVDAISVGNIDALTIVTPVQYKVFQRSGTTGTIYITGTYNGTPTSIEARFNGGSWATIVASPSGGAFSGSLTSQAQGQGLLEVRYTNDTSKSDSVSDVGIGDVFLVAGQSNASGRGSSNQSYSHASLKATLFGNDYVWKNLTDPFDSASNQVDTVSSDSSPAASGSWVPPLATLIMANQSVPVAFIPAPLGGTSITQWQPGANHQNRSTLYGSMVYRGLQITGGIKAVLWWQGETDAGTAMSKATYSSNLSTLVDAIRADLGVPTVLVILQNTSYADADEQNIRDAVTELIASDPTDAKLGPDFSDLTTDDGFHFTTTSNLSTVASRWWTALQTLFY